VAQHDQASDRLAIEDILGAWIVGEVLLLPAFQDDCIRDMVDNERDDKSIPHTLRTVWQETSEDSHLRRFLVDRYMRVFALAPGS
jgi:hypothetical protein